MVCKMMPKDKSNLSEMFFEIGVLKHFAIFTGKQLCRDSNTGSVNIANFLLTTFFAEHLLWLLL